MLGAQGIHATGFKRAQGNAHCAKFESHTNRVTFETNAIRMTSSVQALCVYNYCIELFLSFSNRYKNLVLLTDTDGSDSQFFPFFGLKKVRISFAIKTGIVRVAPLGWALLGCALIRWAALGQAPLGWVPLGWAQLGWALLEWIPGGDRERLGETIRMGTIRVGTVRMGTIRVGTFRVGSPSLIHGTFKYHQNKVFREVLQSMQMSPHNQKLF